MSPSSERERPKVNRRFCMLGLDIISGIRPYGPHFVQLCMTKPCWVPCCFFTLAGNVDVLSPNFGIWASLSMLVHEVHRQGVRHANGN